MGEIDLQIWGVNCTKCVWPPGPAAGVVALHQSPWPLKGEWKDRVGNMEGEKEEERT